VNARLDGDWRREDAGRAGDRIEKALTAVESAPGDEGVESIFAAELMNRFWITRNGSALEARGAAAQNNSLYVY
jgi:hypothetical protein